MRKVTTTGCYSRAMVKGALIALLFAVVVTSIGGLLLPVRAVFLTLNWPVMIATEWLGRTILMSSSDGGMPFALPVFAVYWSAVGALLGCAHEALKKSGREGLSRAGPRGDGPKDNS